MNNIGTIIQTIRMSKAISQRDLSKLSNVPQATLSKIENNTTKITMETLEKLCGALNTTSFQILFLNTLETNDISPAKKIILEKMKPYVEKINTILLGNN